MAAYQHYCWPVTSITDLKLAPFHVMAGEQQLYADRDHVWHMETIARICAADQDLLLATPFKVIDVTDDARQAEGTAWWEDLTSNGGEGMVGPAGSRSALGNLLDR